MKIEDAIKMIRDNPQKQFSNEFGYIMKTETNGIVVRLDSDGDGFGIDISHEWEEVKKPVDFMTALKSGKKMKVEHEFISEPYEKENLSNYYRDFATLLDELRTSWNPVDAREIILRGKWYIED